MEWMRTNGIDCMQCCVCVGHNLFLFGDDWGRRPKWKENIEPENLTNLTNYASGFSNLKIIFHQEWNIDRPGPSKLIIAQIYFYHDINCSVGSIMYVIVHLFDKLWWICYVLIIPCQNDMFMFYCKFHFIFSSLVLVILLSCLTA